APAPGAGAPPTLADPPTGGFVPPAKPDGADGDREKKGATEKDKARSGDKDGSTAPAQPSAAPAAGAESAPGRPEAKPAPDPQAESLGDDASADGKAARRRVRILVLPRDASTR